MPRIADPAATGWNPWATLRLVKLAEVMEIAAGIPEIAVALIDGPVAADHPALAVEGIRFLQLGEPGSCASPGSVACMHGTHVAGLLHAKRDSVLPGICPGCTLLVRSIFSEVETASPNGGVPDATVAELAAALYEVIEAGARVVNLSAGLAEMSSHAEPAIDRALEYAMRRGVIVVAAAGNQGALGSSAITRHPWVIPVVGCNRHGQVLGLSNLGAAIGRHGLAAPGHEIASLAASGGSARFSGSSAAVPFVAGAAALLWSLFPRASPAWLHAAITGSVVRRRSVVPQLLDAWAAYRALASASMGARAQ